jgi:maltodextrin utilization protein YvdJ
MSILKNLGFMINLNYIKSTIIICTLSFTPLSFGDTEIKAYDLKKIVSTINSKSKSYEDMIAIFEEQDPDRATQLKTVIEKEELEKTAMPKVTFEKGNIAIQYNNEKFFINSMNPKEVELIYKEKHIKLPSEATYDDILNALRTSTTAEESEVIDTHLLVATSMVIGASSTIYTDITMDQLEKLVDERIVFCENPMHKSLTSAEEAKLIKSNETLKEYKNNKFVAKSYYGVIDRVLQACEGLQLRLSSRIDNTSKNIVKSQAPINLPLPVPVKNEINSAK